MRQGNDLKSLFQSIENKEALIDLFSKYLVRKCFPEVIKIPIIFTNDRNTFQVAEQSDQLLFTCNHKEANTRVVLHGCLKNTNCVVVSKDTDVFVLMVFAFASKNIKRSWSMNIDQNKYTNIGKVVKYLGKDLVLKLSHIHVVTGCDTKSFMFSVRKVKVLKKRMKQVRKITLLDGFGKTSTDFNRLQLQSVSKCIEIYTDYLLIWPGN